ncbi:MAG: hypothetical protein ACKOCE_03635 [Acidimicrobiia bacterium]
MTTEHDDDLYGVLDHEDDDPLYGLPELGATDERMLEMLDDKGFLDQLRKELGDITDEEFADKVRSSKESLRETIAANNEEWENG